MPLLGAIEDRLRTRGGRLGDLAEHAAGVRERAEEDRVAVVAAGLAFYVLVSMVPALVATVAVYSLVRTPADLFQRIESWTSAFPDEVQRLVAGQLLEVAGMSDSGVGASLAVSILATFWAASKASRAVMSTLNIAYGIEEDRYGSRRRALAVGVVAAAIILAVASLALVDVSSDQAGSWWSTASSILFWPSLVAAAAAVSALAYRFAPNVDGDGVDTVVPGTVVSTAVFVVATGALAVYVTLADLGRAYGAMGAFLGGALWLLAVSWGLLIGGYANVELDEKRHEAGSRHPVRAGDEG